MSRFKESLLNNPYQWLAILLVLPALVINLGLIPFIDDEAIRALVAFEMKKSGNYIIPTLHATHYYSKPPLFNWILLLFFESIGKWDEFVARLPTVVSVLGFAGTIYYFVKKNIGQKEAFISAFAFVTCGRVLFWDSFLALIDITYSWVTFTSFMVIFHYWKKKNWMKLFVLSSFLAGVGFLLKGFPSILFQGSTLIAWLWYQKEIKRLFSWAHIIGVAVFVLMVGSYYYITNIYNDDQLITAGLLEQASSRTVLKQGVGKTISHLFSFPFNMSYHFLPWSLLFVYFFRNNILNKIKRKPFLLFLLLTFVVNIPVYWTSPRVYPRYVLMLFPLLFIIGVSLHERGKGTRRRQLVESIFAVFVAAFTLGSLIPLFLERNYEINHVELKVTLLFLSLGVLSYLYFQNKNHQRLVIFVSVLLIARIGFNWFVLPDRLVNDNGRRVKLSSIEVARQMQSKPLYVYKKSLMQPANSFYLSITRDAIIPRLNNKFPADGNYIIEPSRYPQVWDDTQGKLDSMYMRHNADRYFYIGSLNDFNK